MSGRNLIASNFSNAAVQYDVHASYQHTQTARVFAVAQTHVAADARVLDIGCGTGYFALLAQKAEQDWSITGIDVAHGMCLQAARRCAVLEADAQALPIAPISMDAVVSSLCLQWVSAHDRAFLEIGRVLKPGGYAIVGTLGVGSLPELHQAIAASGSGLRIRRLPAEETYQAAIAGSGLEVLEYQKTHSAEQYVNVQELLDSMRRIGAGNAAPAPTAPVRWKALTGHYPHRNGMVEATWEEYFWVLRKPL